MATEPQIQIDEHGNVSGVSESGYTQDGKRILVGVLFRGKIGFKVGNPPSGHAVGTSFFMVPDELNEKIEEALTAFLPADEANSAISVNKQRSLSCPINGVNYGYIPTGKADKPENLEVAALYKYENKFLPRLEFVRDQRTLMPQWLAEIFVERAGEIFEWAHYEGKSEFYQSKHAHLPWVKGFGPDDYSGTLLTGSPDPDKSPNEDPLAIPAGLKPGAAAADVASPPKGSKAAK